LYFISNNPIKQNAGLTAIYGEKGANMNKAEAKSKLKDLYNEYIKRNEPKEARAISRAMERLNLLSDLEFNRQTAKCIEMYDKKYHGNFFA
jgi:hypothetical protein